MEYYLYNTTRIIIDIKLMQQFIDIFNGFINLTRKIQNILLSFNLVNNEKHKINAVYMISNWFFSENVIKPNINNICNWFYVENAIKPNIYNCLKLDSTFTDVQYNKLVEIILYFRNYSIIFNNEIIYNDVLKAVDTKRAIFVLLSYIFSPFYQSELNHITYVWK